MDFNRRELLKHLGGAALAGAAALRPRAALADLYTEVYPTSPLILAPFTDPLPIPQPLAPSDPGSWAPYGYSYSPPSEYKQDCDGAWHQKWPDDMGLPYPLYYRIRLEAGQHSFTNSLVMPIDANGTRVVPPDGIPGPRSLPSSLIYGFNGTFPGPMINAQYGRPCCVRFENHLGDYAGPENDFGAPDRAFLTHLHNGHTANESDGNPHWKPGAYEPEKWCDNLYLNWPPDGDSREKQSFCWFHDHRMDHTGANVYKGMVGLYPLYDPELDSGDERTGLRLPGVRTDNADGTFKVDYDIPLAFYDCRLDDGVTLHQDAHDSKYPSAGNPRIHPEWWGKTFYRHFPNHGFVGDIFTVNGKAYPVHQVKRRKYRLRFLDASIARVYEFKLMRGQVGAFPGQQGQYNFMTTKGRKATKILGQQCMQFLQVASEGGLLPRAILRDSFQIWPAKRREFVVDFSKYMDGTPTKPGDVIYLANTLQMSNGRKPDDNKDPNFDPNYCVPVLKFVIADGAPPPDNSLISKHNQPLRELPPIPDTATLKTLTQRTFTLERSGTFGGEVEWLINGQLFDPLVSLADVPQGAAELWTIVNGGGGWVHPLHIHQEEHQVVSRNGVNAPDKLHPDDRSKEDVVALEPSESVTIYRKFRSFKGPYVCHCHNLAHEDHAMMFGWRIV